MVLTLLPSKALAVQAPDQINEAVNPVVGTARSIGQSFRPSKSGMITSVSIKLQGVSSATQTVQLSIYEADENGLPMGYSIANTGYRGLYSSNTVSNWFTFDFYGARCPVTADKQYVIVVDGIDANIQYAYNDTDVYTRGSRLTKDTSWSAAAGDLQFQFYMSHYVKYIANGSDAWWYRWTETTGNIYKNELYKKYTDDLSTFQAISSTATDDYDGQQWNVYRLGYAFQGWSTDPNADVVSYVPGATYNINGAITLYGVWLSHTGLPNQSILPIGGAITGSTNGTWTFDSAYFNQRYDSGNWKFCAKQAGNTTLRFRYYDTADNNYITHQILVEFQPDLPSSHTMIAGDTVTWAPATLGGSWSYDGSFFDFDGTVFTAKKGGITNVTYTVNGIAQTISVTVIPNLPDSYTMLTSQSVTFESISGGQWSYDASFFDLSGSTFTAKQSGSSTITYTVNGIVQNISLTIKQAVTSLPESYTMLVGDTVNWNPSPSGGSWTYDNTFFDQGGDGLSYTAKQAGTTAVSYTTTEGVVHTIAVTVITNLPDTHTLINNSSVTFIAVPAGGSWSYSGIYFNRNGTTFTAKQAGTATISYGLNGVWQQICVTIITDLPDSQTLINGASVTFSPVPNTGSWGYDSSFFDLNGSTFTAKQAGTSIITYTVNGVMQSIPVTIVTHLPDSHAMIEGESVAFTPVPGAGSWGYDSSFFDLNGSTFTAKQAGNSTITYTLNGVMQSITVTIKQAITNLPTNYTMVTDSTVIWNPAPAGGSWTYNNAFFHQSGLLFTAEQAGITTVTYTTAEGVTQDITVTIITNLPDNHTMINGEAITFAPVPGNGSWTYDNSAFDLNGSTFTAKKAGITNITYTLNGVVQSIELTVVTDLPGSHTLVNGESVTFASIPNNGSWAYDSAFFDCAGSTFTAKQAGNSAIAYTVNGLVQNIAFTVVSDLPSSHTLINGGSVTFSPVPGNGSWGYDNTFFDLNGSTFTAKQAGVSTITYTLNGVMQSIPVTIYQAVTNLPISYTLISGNTVTWTPEPSGGNWTYDNTYFNQNGDGLSFTAKQAGTATVTYTTVEGVVHDIAVTIVTNLPDSHTMVNGESVTFKPLPDNGEWAYNNTYFSLNGSTFTAKKIGTSNITYTLNGIVQNIEVTINPVITVSETSTMTVGDTIKFNLQQPGGRWTYDSTYFDLGADTLSFIAKKAGTSTITYTVTGYVKSYIITVTEKTSKLTIIGTNIRVRADSSIKSRIIGIVTRGQTFELYAYKNGFVQILFRGKKGWISADYIKLTYPKPLQGVTSKRLTLYNKMSLSSKKLATVNSGQELKITGRNGLWLVVDYNGNVCYALAKYTVVPTLRSGYDAY